MESEPQTTADRPIWRDAYFWAIVVVAGAAVLLALFLSGRDGRPGSGPSHPDVGTPLADLELEPLTGATQPVSLADVRGKVVLMNFWGTWCPPCVQEFPHLFTLWQGRRERNGFQFLSVSCSGGRLPEPVEELRVATQRFLDQRHADLPTYADTHARSRLGAKLQVYPTTYVVDKDGIIRGRWDGYRPGYEREMEGLVDRLLSQP